MPKSKGKKVLVEKVCREVTGVGVLVSRLQIITNAFVPNAGGQATEDCLLEVADLLQWEAEAVAEKVDEVPALRGSLENLSYLSAYLRTLVQLFPNGVQASSDSDW